MPRRRRTVFEIVQHQLGFLRATKVLAFMMEWAILQADLERQPTIDEYVEWWEGGVSRATAYRYLADFRDCFEPWGIKDPSGLFAVLGIDPANFSASDLMRGAGHLGERA